MASLRKTEFKVGDWVMVPQSGHNDTRHPKHSGKYIISAGYIGVITNIDTDRSYGGYASICLNGVAYTGDGYIESFDKARFLKKAKEFFPIGTEYNPIDEDGKHFGSKYKIKENGHNWYMDRGIYSKMGEGGLIFSFKTNTWAEIVNRPGNDIRVGVRVILTSDFESADRGKIGTVINMTDSVVGVDFYETDRGFSGHNLCGRIKTTTGYNIRLSYLEYYDSNGYITPEYTDKNPFKIGDSVVVKSGYRDDMEGLTGIIRVKYTTSCGIDFEGKLKCGQGHNLSGGISTSTGWYIDCQYLELYFGQATAKVVDDLLPIGSYVISKNIFGNGKPLVGRIIKYYYAAPTHFETCYSVDFGDGFSGHNLEGSISTNTGYNLYGKNIEPLATGEATVSADGPKVGRVLSSPKVSPVIIKGEVPRGRVLEGRKKKSEIASSKMTGRILTV